MNAQELKIGQTVTYTVGDRTLTLKPLPLGKMKKATLIFTEKNGDSMETIARYLAAILDDGVTLEWVLDNVTLPQANEMVDASRVINGLGSFFQQGVDPKPAEIRQERPLEETPTPIPSV